MVVISDFHKQILYQRLNLGYECSFCKKKFYSKREQLQHLQEFHLKPRKKDHFECSRCGKSFGHIQIYKLHLQIHALSEPKSRDCASSNSAPKNVNQVPATQQQPKPTATRPKQKAATAKKRVGLTKIKMEDCLRCDECSCIYIDRNDYYKHMRNFHKVDLDFPEIPTTTMMSSSPTPAVNREPISAKPVVSPVKICRSCCRYCRDNRFSKDTCRHHLFHRHGRIIQSPTVNELLRFSMQNNIKDRWSKIVSQNSLPSNDQPCENIYIKPDPDAAEAELSYQSSIIDSEEMSHLLSQVEVKIKTEPMEDDR